MGPDNYRFWISKIFCNGLIGPIFKLSIVGIGMQRERKKGQFWFCDPMPKHGFFFSFFLQLLLEREKCTSANCCNLVWLPKKKQSRSQCELKVKNSYMEINFGWDRRARVAIIPRPPWNTTKLPLGLNQHQISDEKILRPTGKGLWTVFQMNSFLDEIDFMTLDKLVGKQT